MVAELVLPEFDPRGGEAGARDRERIARQWDDTRDWLDLNGRRLSDRIWVARQATRDAIDQAIRQAIVTGKDPLVLARELETYLNPANQPIRDETGRLVRNQPRRIVTPTPIGRSGAGSASARRLARTEISRAFAEATRQSAAMNPFVHALQWRVSGNHPAQDECDMKASRDNGLGPGVYRILDFPSMPAHPHCRCTTISVQTDDTDSVIRQLRRDFDLDNRNPVAVRPLRIVRGPEDQGEREGHWRCCGVCGASEEHCWGWRDD